ncbi:MAG TPA: VWA domain-containing protein [Vicinamibacterales bacterium]|nr:VWA domain-containing protein [Vicinamibacterales bacterium]
MIPRIDFETISFETPLYLWLLVVPGLLLVLWILQVIRRRADARRLFRSRLVPVRERFALAGDLTFWLSVLIAASLCIVALAGPRARISAVRTSSADLVILLDGSASMYVTDVSPDRWRRAVRFLRTFAEALSWRGDRVALALFAHLSSPQVRLTKDPNALFFFLDHLGDRSPFRLEDAPTWDTNIEEGIRWGLRLVEKDEELFGKSGNPRAFVVITDGQAWSGSVETSLRQARSRRIPVYVVGVGTTVGGIIPQPTGPGATPVEAIRSVLDRGSLIRLAQGGGGEYFEIGRGSDRDVAFGIIDRLRHLDERAQVIESFQELYWRFLLAAGVVLCVGAILLRRRTELTWQAATAAAVVLLLVSIL